MPTWATTTATTANTITWLSPYMPTSATTSLLYPPPTPIVWYDGRYRRPPQYDPFFEEARVATYSVARPAIVRAAARHPIDDAAKARARELLLDSLTPEQRAMFELQGWFIVWGGKSGRKYRIRGNRESVVANIDVMDQDWVTQRLCGHCPPGQVPFADQLLAQKLMLEFAEEDFLRIANRHAP
jgi:hypothetical protein